MVDYTDIGVNQAQQSHNAYMLVYEKAVKNPLQIVCSEETLSLIKGQSREVIQRASDYANPRPLSCDGTAIPRDTRQEQSQRESNAFQLTMTTADGTATELSMASAQSSESKRLESPVDIEMLTSSSWTEADEAAYKRFMDQIPHTFLILPGLIERIHRD